MSGSAAQPAGAVPSPPTAHGDGGGGAAWAWACAAEAAATGAGGAALGWGIGWLLHPAVGVAAGAVAGANGLVSGWRGIYHWRSGRGVRAFLLDSTWATLPVAGGLVAHLVAVVSRRAGYEASLSHRQGRHVYRSGAQLKRGFALTIGNVISGAGDVDNARRRKLITDHEAVHVGQARCFGPLYPLTYVLWTAFGAVAGCVLWVRRGRSEPLGKVVESCSYYLNPYEWWAYSRDGLWPPPGLVRGIGWRKPAVRSFADRREHRERGH